MGRARATDAIRQELAAIFADAEEQASFSPEAPLRSLSPISFRARGGFSRLPALPTLLIAVLVASGLMTGVTLLNPGSQDASAQDRRVSAGSGAAAPAPRIPAPKIGGSAPDHAQTHSSARRCEETVREGQRRCPPAAVPIGERMLAEAYAEAVRANLPPGILAAYSRRWSDVRRTAADHPQAAAAAYDAMTRQLQSLAAGKKR